DIAFHVHIREEVHLDLLHTVALAGLAAPALHIEAEAPRLVATHAALRQFGEQVADAVPHAHIGRRVGARRAPDRPLADLDDLVNVLGDPADLAELARLAHCPV